SVFVLPASGACSLKERLQRLRNVLDAQASSPRLLPVDVHVELRDLPVIARVRLRHARHAANGLQHLLRRNLQARRLGTLYEDADGLSHAAEDAARTADGGTYARDGGQLF